MLDIIILLVHLVLIGQAAVGLSYLISSIWELEKRASIFAGIQFLAMAGLVLLLGRGSRGFRGDRVSSLFRLRPGIVYSVRVTLLSLRGLSVSCPLARVRW